MKKCVECGKAFSTSRRCQSCGKEVDPKTGRALNFCLLCHGCYAAIEGGLDLRKHRNKKKERMKRCAQCISD
jgi:hypothetical protein